MSPRLPVFAPFAEPDAEPIAHALVDAADHDRLSAVRWTLTEKGYAQARLGGVPVRLHAAVLGLGTGHVDHINRLKLDCRRSNLRRCTPLQNAANKGPSGGRRLKGVHAFRGRWRAKIQVDGRQRHLGVYDTPEAAAMAYDSAAREAFGEFAWLNAVHSAHVLHVPRPHSWPPVSHTPRAGGSL